MRQSKADKINAIQNETQNFETNTKPRENMELKILKLNSGTVLDLEGSKYRN